MLTVGILMTPLWLTVLVAMTFIERYRHSTSAFEAVLVVVSILEVIGGVLGLVGLFRVLRGLLCASEKVPRIGQTRVFVLMGVGTLLYLAAISLWGHAIFLRIVALPPLLASVHIAYLTRGRLFAYNQ